MLGFSLNSQIENRFQGLSEHEAINKVLTLGVTDRYRRFKSHLKSAFANVTLL